MSLCARLDTSFLQKLVDILKKPRDQRDEQDHRDIEYIMDSVNPNLGLVEPEDKKRLFVEVADALNVESFSQGDIIYTQGTMADKFYFVLSGEVGAYIDKDDEESVFVSSVKVGEAFSQKSLTYNKPRLRTMIAMKNTHCGTLSNSDFQRLLKRNFSLQESQQINFLWELNYLKGLDFRSVKMLHSACESHQFQMGQNVYREDTDFVTHAYIIKKGTFIIHKKLRPPQEEQQNGLNLNANGIKTVNQKVKYIDSQKCLRLIVQKICIMSVGELFGIEDLLEKKERRSYTVQCHSIEGELYSISKDLFRILILHDPSCFESVEKLHKVYKKRMDSLIQNKEMYFCFDSKIKLYRHREIEGNNGASQQNEINNEIIIKERKQMQNEKLEMMNNQEKQDKLSNFDTQERSLQRTDKSDYRERSNGRSINAERFTSQRYDWKEEKPKKNQCRWVNLEKTDRQNKFVKSDRQKNLERLERQNNQVKQERSLNVIKQNAKGNNEQSTSKSNQKFDLNNSEYAEKLHYEGVLDRLAKKERDEEKNQKDKQKSLDSLGGESSQNDQNMREFTPTLISRPQKPKYNERKGAFKRMNSLTQTIADHNRQNDSWLERSSLYQMNVSSRPDLQSPLGHSNVENSRDFLSITQDEEKFQRKTERKEKRENTFKLIEILGDGNEQPVQTALTLTELGDSSPLSQLKRKPNQKRPNGSQLEQITQDDEEEIDYNLQAQHQDSHSKSRPCHKSLEYQIVLNENKEKTLKQSGSEDFRSQYTSCYSYLPSISTTLLKKNVNPIYYETKFDRNALDNSRILQNFRKHQLSKTLFEHIGSCDDTTNKSQFVPLEQDKENPQPHKKFVSNTPHSSTKINGTTSYKKFHQSVSLLQRDQMNVTLPNAFQTSKISQVSPKKKNNDSPHPTKEVIGIFNPEFFTMLRGKFLKQFTNNQQISKDMKDYKFEEFLKKHLHQGPLHEYLECNKNLEPFVNIKRRIEDEDDFKRQLQLIKDVASSQFESNHRRLNSKRLTCLQTSFSSKAINLNTISFSPSPKFPGYFNKFSPSQPLHVPTKPLNFPFQSPTTSQMKYNPLLSFLNTKPKKRNPNFFLTNNKCSVNSTIMRLHSHKNIQSSQLS